MTVRSLFKFDNSEAEYAVPASEAIECIKQVCASSNSSDNNFPQKSKTFTQRAESSENEPSHSSKESSLESQHSSSAHFATMDMQFILARDSKVWM